LGADLIRRLHLRLLKVGPCRGHINHPYMNNLAVDRGHLFSSLRARP